MSSDWPDAQLSNIQKTLQNSWQIPYISLFARIFCEAFELFDFHQEELEDALLSDNPNEIHPFLQELLISLLSGLTRLHVNSNNMFLMLTSILKRCNLTIVTSTPTSLTSISDDSISTTDWQEMGIFEKVTVLRALCDARLDRADIEQVTETMPADSLRFEPFGEDCRGNKFWYFSDTRLYRETPKKNSETSTWECICRTLEEWNTFIEQFRKSSARKSVNSKDRQLFERFLTLTADLPDLFTRKERERQRRWTSYEPKRASTRLEAKRQQRLELEEITQEQKARHEKFLEYRRRQEETVARERERLERSERVRRREERADRIRRRAQVGSGTGLDASEHSENSNTSSTLNDDNNTQPLDTSDIHQKVLTLLRTNENSWPFLEPVTEELAPNYFSIIEHPMDLSTIQQKMNTQIYLNNSAEFIRDIELIVSNCEKYNGKRSILGRLANRLLRYFRDCWSECQPITPQIDDDDDDLRNYPNRENPLKRRLHESSSNIVTRDKNNNTRPRRNYRQLAGLSDDDDYEQEMEYVPTPTSKRSRHSLHVAPTYITIDPNSPASMVYHDHSYFIRHESSNSSSTDNGARRKTATPISSTTIPTVQVLNRLLLERQSNNKSVSASTSANSLDLATILRAFLAKQKHHLTSTIAKDSIESTTSSLSPSAAAS